MLSGKDLDGCATLSAPSTRAGNSAVAGPHELRDRSRMRDGRRGGHADAGPLTTVRQTYGGEFDMAARQRAFTPGNRALQPQ